jgi:hypothetical protein
MKLKKEILATAFLCILLQTALSQTIIRGTVYSRIEGIPVQGVSVLAISGVGTSTDSLGHFSIHVNSRDSIYFSWQGKSTDHFAVSGINSNEPFNLNLDEANVSSLPALQVSGERDYRMDSVSNRSQYQSVFGYETKSGMQEKNLNQAGGLGPGWDLNKRFSPSADNHTEALQQKPLENEQDAYVNHKFSRALVKKITGLESPALESFMKAFRPRYDELRRFETDYEYYQWISDMAKVFKDEWGLQTGFLILTWDGYL